MSYNCIQLVHHQPNLNTPLNSNFIRPEIIERVLRFHQSIPHYNPTPLVAPNQLASYLGLDGLWVKDESKRFGLNAFKSLGGSYAIASYLADYYNLPTKTLTYETMLKTVQSSKPLTFVTATDGNHGRGVAWAARQFNQKAVVYMPHGSQPSRIQAIIDEGAQVTVFDGNYDDTVRFAAHKAKSENWVLMQDTAWDGYTEIPTWIMQGYLTVAFETLKQLGDNVPTHVILQAGVGSFAAAIIASLRYHFSTLPTIILAEPHQANCYYHSAKMNDDKPHVVTGALDTIMAGLACGEPNPLAWSIIHPFTSAYVSCDDTLSAYGMRLLGNPLPGDERLISGESAAIGTGLIAYLMTNPAYTKTRQTLGLTKDARVLCFSTEGDTDPWGYRQIVWEGKYPLV